MPFGLQLHIYCLATHIDRLLKIDACTCAVTDCMRAQIISHDLYPASCLTDNLLKHVVLCCTSRII